SGYRESLAEERVVKALEAVGASPDALSTLVNRRLLRIEERLDMRRVELTHDVLCSVVLSSRNLRHERESRDEAQRRLAEQQEREAATHRALLRARTIASVCAVLMLIAVAGAIFGWINLHRARIAEAEAQKSRSDAEKLVSFLIEDFYTELEPTGRLETLGKLAKMTVGYYDNLPPELVTTQTQINRAMALLREAAAQNASGDIDTAFKNYGQAQAVFEALRADGHRGEAVTYGLALALYYQGGNIIGGGARGTTEQLVQAADLLRPLVQQPNPSRESRQLYADTLNVLSHTQPKPEGVKTCEEALKVLVSLGALELTDLDATASYADTADSEARHLLSLGRVDEALKLEQQVYDLAEKVLQQRPSDLHSLANRYYAAELLTELARRRHDVVSATDYAMRTVRAGEDAVRFNPSDLNAWQFWALALGNLSDLQFEQGDVATALATAQSQVALEEDKRRPSSLARIMWGEWIGLAKLQTQLGQTAAAQQSAKNFARDVGIFVAQLAPGDPRKDLLMQPTQSLDGTFQLAAGNTQAAYATATATASRIAAIVVPSERDRFSAVIQIGQLNSYLGTAIQAALRTGRFAEAEALAKRRLAVPASPISTGDQEQVLAPSQAMLAHAVAMQGRKQDAQTALQPALAYYQQELQAGAQETHFRMDYTYALYVDALSQADDAAGNAQRAVDLEAATAQMAGLSEQARQLVDARLLAQMIAAEKAKH
ncbi:MAG: hypothetical protein ABI858_08770, partial [Pseudoxanthomonas sp.]